MTFWLTRSKVFLSALELVHAKCTIISTVKCLCDDKFKEHTLY